MAGSTTAPTSGSPAVPARVRSTKDKPRVERTVQYVRGNFWAGERFDSLTQAQEAAVRWCSSTAGMRIHGTTCARPLEVFDDAELPKLLAVPAEYDVPIFKDVKVHRDFHAEIGRALYSLPQQCRIDTVGAVRYRAGEVLSPRHSGGSVPANLQVGAVPTAATCPSTRATTPYVMSPT